MDVGAFGGEPFTIAQARAAGMSVGELRSGRFERVFQGVYVAAAVPITLAVRARAALLLEPAGVLSHHSAAVLLGACAPETDDVHLTVQRERRAVRTRVAGLVVHEKQQQALRFHGGLPVTTAPWTFLDLAAHLELTELVAAGDSLVRRAGATPDQLAELAEATTCRGVRRARAAAELVRSGVDSPMESRLRMLLVLAGLPEPVVGTDVHFAGGGWLAKPDLHYPAQKIAIEYDGRHHLDDPRQWRRDIARRPPHSSCWAESTRTWPIAATPTFPPGSTSTTSPASPSALSAVRLRPDPIVAVRAPPSGCGLTPALAARAPRAQPPPSRGKPLQGSAFPVLGSTTRRERTGKRGWRSSRTCVR